jgi:Mn-dependent DtxR family transcriptional regulator
MGHIFALDTILSAASFFVWKWTPELKHNQSRDLLRFLLCRLYDQGRGQLVNAQVTLAQGTLARKLGLSRQWVGTLLDRLQAAGWVEYHAPVLEAGMRGSTIFRIGRQLKRLLVMLSKARPRKSAKKSDAKSRWHFSPTLVEKKILSFLAKENEPPKPHVLSKIPLLGRWLERGRPDQ